jgi:hypothetical protein
MTYRDADTLLQGRCRERRKLENNTYLERHDDSIAVRLHGTDVLAFYRDGGIGIDTGGWNTVTTRDRMNRYLPNPWRVGSERGSLVLFRMRPVAWQPLCTVDRDVLIKTDGHSYEEFRQRVRERDNEVNRVRSRISYWLRKARNHQGARGLTVQNILEEEDASVRLAKMHVYGLDRFLLDAKAAVIHQEAGYQLLQLDWGTWDRITALKMTCPSTGAVYVSPVPPNVRSVPEDLDWMFDTKDYLGQVVQQS